MTDPLITVRCPDPLCRQVFPVALPRLGRNVRCPACGVALTARPVEVEERLLEQQKRVRGVSGSPVLRLPLAVLLDDVRSLWNVGAIFRTADACGVGRMALCGITGFPPRAEIAKTALGAEDAVPWTYHADARQGLEALLSDGYVPVVVENGADAAPVAGFAWPERPCLVIGNEVTGVSEAILERCAQRVRIPMRGVKDSLNAAVAFGIVAHAAATALESHAPDRRQPAHRKVPDR